MHNKRSIGFWNTLNLQHVGLVCGPIILCLVSSVAQNARPKRHPWKNKRNKEVQYRILWVYGIHWKQIMSNCHYISCQEMHGGTTVVNIHCPFSPSAQICSQANWPNDITWSQATKCLQTLAKQIPTPQTKRTTLMTLMNMFDTLSSPGTLLFKNANKPCIVSHGGEHGWENETQVMDMWYVPAVQRNECVLNQGPPSKTKHCENSKIGFWDCNQFMRLHMQTVLSNKQKPSKPWKLSFVNLWKSLHTLKSRSPAHTTSNRSFAQTESQSLFPACCRTASVNWKL